MVVLDVRPDSIDVLGYAGDTLTLAVVAPASLVDGKTWKAEIRSAESSSVVDASFAITPPTVADGPAYLVLDSETTRLLAGTGVLRRIRSRDGTTYEVIRYKGVFDCQVSVNGSDPVRTLVKGTLSIDQDVTRE
jgi:hypothetical protein